jgi:hypothetical protein
MPNNFIKRETEWYKIPGSLEKSYISESHLIYFDTRDLYLLIRTLLEKGYETRFDISDIYEKRIKSNEFIESNVSYICMDITGIILPNMFGSIRLLGIGNSRINISSQFFDIEDNHLTEDGFIVDISQEELKNLSLRIGEFTIAVNIYKSDFIKILDMIPDTRAKLEKEENEKAQLYNQMSRETEGCPESILHYLDDD